MADDTSKTSRDSTTAQLCAAVVLTFLAPALLCALLLLASAPADAKRMYKYTDENGIVHYTDRPPEGETAEDEVETWLVEVDQSPMLTVRRERLSDHTRVHAFNHWHGPIEVAFRFDQSQNIVSKPALPARLVVESYGESPVLRIAADDPGRGASYTLSYEAAPGDPAARPDGTLYRLPFRSGGRYYVGQGFGGMASHTDPQAWHAVDITMPEGTPVVAARDGVVMVTAEDFFGAGLNRDRFAGRANNVRVVHADGTMAVYAHLQVESVAVKAGQRVRAGELLGLSGNTGYSTGPHLHFVIQRNAGMKLESVPFKFDDGRGNPLPPDAGTWLEHR